MNFPDLSSSNKQSDWCRFCDLLWFSEELGIWLDISRMNVNTSDLNALESALHGALSSMDELEKGSLANRDENRMVGHYWLRSPELSPSEEISESITNQIQEVEEFSNSILNGSVTTDKGNLFSDVLWIGIGGSGLGPMLLVNSLQKINQGLKFHFLDNVDPIGINNKFKEIGDNLETCLVVVVSKSGGTPEPKICMDQAQKLFQSNGFKWNNRAIAITMPGSQLDELALKENWLKRFELPDWVGGRTSITSAVGLLPLYFIKDNAKKFLAGASIMDKITRSDDLYKNPAILLAASWYAAGSGKGQRDMVVLPYSDSLEVISKYLQQLVMESLGKKTNRSGQIVNQGLAVYGNKGSTDQHAYVQQLRDGIDNFFVTFVEVLSNEQILQSLNDKSPSDYLSGFLQGTRQALSDNKRQNLTITINKFNSFTLGALIALFERAVGLYAELININAYNQPGVEAGKKAAASILETQSKITSLLSDGNQYSLRNIINKIDCHSIDSIYMIIRHMTYMNDQYEVIGNWNEPLTLSIRYKL